MHTIKPPARVTHLPAHTFDFRSLNLLPSAIVACLFLLLATVPLYASPALLELQQTPQQPDAPHIAGLGVPLGDPITLSSTAAGAHSVQSADMDNDGDLDLIVASRGDGVVRWLRNDGATSPNFEERVVGGLPGAYSAIPADVNGDGWMDIVAASVSQVQPSTSDTPAASDAPQNPLVNGAVVWYENNRADPPAYGQHIIFSEIQYPVSVFAADMDNDGDIDVASASRDDDRIIWYENNGAHPAPAFAAHALTADADGAVSVHGGDLDNDGDIDLVSASENDNQIAWFDNQRGAPASFLKRVIRVSPPEFPDYAKAVYAVDVDGDGDLDIVYGSEDDNEIGWYENNGARPAEFAQHVVATELDHIKAVFGADMDADGDVDLFSASSGDDTVAWFENDGQQPPAFTQHIVTESADGARSVHAADVDGDGDLDILATARESGRVYWYPNLSIHRSARYPAGPESVVATHHGSRHLTPKDVDGDGDQDLVSINDGNIRWHENDGQRPPTFTDHLVSHSITGGRWVEAADMDNDGDIDLLAASLKNELLFWYENGGDNSLSFTERVLSNSAHRPRAVLAADLNNDGQMDAYAASDEDHSINWFANDGAQPPNFTRHLVTNEALYARSTYAADLDDDGDLDLLSAAQITDEIAWYENDGEDWPEFQRRVIVSIHAPLPLPDGGSFAPDGAQHVHADDMDGDGDIDVLSVSEHDNTIAWYENDGAAPPSFSAHFVTRDAPGVHAVYSGDADQDGDVDVFAAIEYNNTIAWYENDGQPSPNFAPHPFYNRAIIAHAINAADMDSDGDLDLLATSRQDGKVLWFENLGGQYSLDVVADSNGVIEPGRSDELMSVEVGHQGRSGDTAIALASFDIEFHNQDNQPMTALEMNGIFNYLAVYRDGNGDGRFDPEGDQLVVQVDELLPDAMGRVTIPFGPRDPASRLVAQEVKRYFVVTEIAGACGANYPPFTATLIVAGGSGRDADTNAPLLPELARAIDQDGVDVTDPTPIVFFINEFMADNDSTMEDPDEPGEYPDWVELYNPAPTAVDMSGMYLTDDPDSPTLYRIPDGVEIPARGYLVFIVDGEFTQGPLHTNFRLSKGGESIGVFDTDAAANQPIDVYSFGAQETDISEGRFSDGEDNWVPMPGPTPGDHNTDRIYYHYYYLPTITYQIGC